jgi:hypothetical protein
MPATFGEVWRTVRLHVPNAPVMLVRNWVQSAYAQLTDSRPWSWTMQYGQLTWEDSRELDCTVTIGSTAITSAALFVAGDAGRQFRVGNYPIYTIASVTDTSNAVLQDAYHGEDDGAVEGEILDAYATLPADFGAFLALVDPINQRWVPWWVTMDEINILDPTRQAAASTPRLLASLALSEYDNTLGRAQYEYWPKPDTAGAFQYYYRLRPTALTDSVAFRGVLGDRPDILETGALAQAARWPGTVAQKNPYFNLQLARELNEEFRALSNQLDLRDDDMYQNSYEGVPWRRWSAWAWAYDTHLLQQTDATLSAYIGYGGYPG